ncbi:MAG TPA: Hsp20 family protein [Woeseiaceae bacterium]|nr:Hsp20 family protein [Woeseiaceae bacterium]
MSKLNVEKVRSVDERSLPVFDEFNEIAEKIRVRAFNLFAGRGFGEGNDLEDWLRAEREICWPTAELVEEDDEFEVKVALAGFDPKDITVTANPRELIIKATHKDEQKKKDKKADTNVRWSEFRSNNVYRHIALPAEIDVDKISAEFEHGMLEIEAPKAKRKLKARSGKDKNVKVSS